MKWWALRKNKCPICSGDLVQDPNSALLMCDEIQCTFKISQERMQEIVGGQNKRAMEMSDPIQEEHNNFRRLQQLGQEELPTEEGDDDKLLW